MVAYVDEFVQQCWPLGHDTPTAGPQAPPPPLLLPFPPPSGEGVSPGPLPPELELQAAISAMPTHAPNNFLFLFMTILSLCPRALR
jgi:hypothetical protein